MKNSKLSNVVLIGIVKFAVFEGFPTADNPSYVEQWNVIDIAVDWLHFLKDGIGPYILLKIMFHFFSDLLNNQITIQIILTPVWQLCRLHTTTLQTVKFSLIHVLDISSGC